MAEFTLRFKADNKALQFPDFEKNLALRLLDILCGRNKQCTPDDPVPFTSDKQEMRMIGNHNDYWLKREDASTYRVISRYFDADTAARMQAANTIISQQYSGILEPSPVASVHAPPKPVLAVPGNR